MKTSVIYRSSWLYEACVLALYRSGYRERYSALAELIPANTSVVDICCGPATLYFGYLRHKQVRYTGLDISPTFVQQLLRRGVNGLLWDVHSSEAFPVADYIVMQGSLYQFLPDPANIVGRMLAAATRQVIISEPVRNLADSKNPLLRRLSQKLTNAGTGDQMNRFNEGLFHRFLEPYRLTGQLVALYSIAAGREKVCVLDVRPEPGRKPASKSSAGRTGAG